MHKESLPLRHVQRPLSDLPLIDVQRGLGLLVSNTFLRR